MVLSPLRRRPRGARRGIALAVRLSPGGDRLHLVRDVRRDSSRRRPDRGRAPRLLEPADGLARRRRARLAPLRLRLLSPLLPRSLLGPRPAPAAIPDQVLSADDALHGAPGRIRRPAAAPGGRPRRPAGRRPPRSLSPSSSARRSLVSREAKAFDRAVAPLLSGLALPASELLPEIRRSLAGDAFFGLLATAVLGLILFSRRPIRGQCHLLGLATLLLAFPWALPLFVSADEKDLARPPALAGNGERDGPRLRGSAAPERQRPVDRQRAPGAPAARRQAREGRRSRSSSR